MNKPVCMVHSLYGHSVKKDFKYPGCSNRVGEASSSE